MPNPLATKLQHGAVLTDADRNNLDRVTERTISVGAREVVMDEGDPCRQVYVLLSGWACRFKVVPGGSRQIVAIMLPGDHSALHSGFGHITNHGLCALTRSELAEIDGAELTVLVRASPNLERAFQWSSISTEATLQEWLANVGRRPAEQRVAHLLCELLARLEAVGLASANTFALPLTQAMLGDALGLSPAHVNRTLQTLRTRGLVLVEDGKVDVSDVARLKKFAGFNPRYLNLDVGHPAQTLPLPM